LTANFRKKDLKGTNPVLLVEGWNVEPKAQMLVTGTRGESFKHAPAPPKKSAFN
jgi:hypothetical protein